MSKSKDEIYNFDLDTLRIENAIWVLEQYKSEIKFIAEQNSVDGIDTVLNTLGEVRKVINRVNKTR